MPKKCCIPSCQIQDDHPEGLHLSFFRVPKDEIRRARWTSSINYHFIPKVEFKNYSYVCQLHFEETSFSIGKMGTRYLRLTNQAYPTIFDNASVNSHKEHNYALTSDIHSNDDNSLSEEFFKPVEYESTDGDQEISNCNVEQREFKSSSKCSDNVHHSNSSSKNVHSNFKGQTCSRSLFSKPFENISVDSIDFKDEILIRNLFKKAQNELRRMRLKLKSQRMKYYRETKKVENLDGVLGNVKNRKVISNNIDKMPNVNNNDA
uniref:Uncharacterized protein LOC114336045 n=1 Tax=Diabrotica virgifera virgifera TaxID=50390 RepID=A0A6P7G579_DIAVI